VRAPYADQCAGACTVTAHAGACAHSCHWLMGGTRVLTDKVASFSLSHPMLLHARQERPAVQWVDAPMEETLWPAETSTDVRYRLVGP